MLNKKIKKINNTLYLVAASILLLICIIAVTGYDYNSVKKRTLERTEGVLAASSREQSTLFIEKIEISSFVRIFFFGILKVQERTLEFKKN